MATIHGVFRLEGTVACQGCHAGHLVGFNRAQASDRDPAMPVRSGFEVSRPLRSGALYRCKRCDRPWYLSITTGLMSLVPDERMALILAWDRSRILLSPSVTARLGQIGPTPPDQYGNGGEYRETPCGVVTTAGERIDLAVVSLQSHAPFEPWRRCRLGSEIADVYPSPHALPLAVRRATAQAEEIRMGYAPTLVEAPGGRILVLNWRSSFLVMDGIEAPQVRLLQRRSGIQATPEMIAPPPGEVTYFIADGRPASGRACFTVLPELVGATGLEPVCPFRTADFKSAASAGFATLPCRGRWRA